MGRRLPCGSLLPDMRITFKSDGGFVYLPAQAEPVTIDTHDLPAEEADELERLIEAARFFDLPETSTPSRGADYLQYTISVTDPELSHTVSFTDPIEDPHLRALVEFLETKAHGPGTTR